MEHRKLGKNGPEVFPLGLGCMGMSYAYGPADEKESLRVLGRYLELGGNFLDTAEVYGPYKNEELLGRFLRTVPRDSVVVATKFGFRIGSAGIQGADSLARDIPGVLVMEVFVGWESKRSTFTISIGLIRKFQLRKPLVRWLNWFKRGKSERLVCRKPGQRRSGEPRRCIRLRRCKVSIRFGRAMWKQTAC